jgi:hypothetical protein
MLVTKALALARVGNPYCLMSLWAMVVVTFLFKDSVVNHPTFCGITA